MYTMTDMQYQTVYNSLSFSLACMMATTMFLWFRASAVKDQFKSAVLISGLVTFIAAYRYMDWLLTVPLLLIEILLVMKLDEATYNKKAWTLGFGSALMIVSGYYGELTLSGDLTVRGICWAASMAFFLYIVYELLVGLQAAIKLESDPVIGGKIQTAAVWTVISWCTYPIVYLFPFFGITQAKAVVGIQLGYSISDIISKCGVGLVIYQISCAKSKTDDLLP